MELFIRFNQVGTTVMIASHDLELISSLGKPMVRLHEGHLQRERAPESA
jgi:cell division transport system ATP-binding protein